MNDRLIYKGTKEELDELRRKRRETEYFYHNNRRYLICEVIDIDENTVLLDMIEVRTNNLNI